MQKRNLMQYQPLVVNVVMQLANYGCGASLMRSMLDLLKLIYTSGDFTKLSGCFLSSKIFKSLWSRSHSPPTKELIDAYFKLAKQSTEVHPLIIFTPFQKFTKECAYKALKQIIKANPSNLHMMNQEVFKHIQKALTQEKGSEVRSDVVMVLRVFVQSTLNYSSMHLFFEQILAQCIKGFEDTNQEVIEEYILTCFYLFNLRLSETQQQGDLKTSFRIFNQQQRDALSSQKKKSQPNLIDVPRTLADITAFFAAILLRIQGNIGNMQSTDNLRYALSQVLVRLVEKNRIHLETHDPEQILSPLLLTLSNKTASVAFQDIETYKQREVSFWIISQVLQFYESGQKSQLLKHCLQCLLKRQIILSKESVDNFQGFCKNQKVSTMINEAQTIMFLQIVSDILFQVDQSFIKKHFNSEKELIDPIIPYIRDQQSQATRIFAIEALKCLGYQSTQWIHELISIFLTFTTITNADLTAIKQAPVYIYTLDKSQMRQDSLIMFENLNILNNQALALSCLVSGISHSLKGVPLALMNSTFNAAKGMILGNWKVEDDDEECYFANDLQKLDLQENQRREAGWIIMEGMIHLGNQWMGSRLSLFFKLLNSVFTKDMCQINPIMMKEPNYLEKILNEFKIKKAALSTMRCFLNKSFVLLNNQLVKLISTFLVNATTFFFNQDKDKKDVSIVFKQYFPEEYQQVKSDLFECLLQIPSSLYQNKFVHLLHTICEEIVSDDIQRVPFIYKRLIHFEDLQIGKENKKIKKFISQINLKHIKLFLADESIQQEQYYQLLRLDRPISQLKYEKHLSTKDHLINYSIQLFSEIFSNQQLNIKNKQQLIKHFIVHTTPPATQILQGGKKTVQTPQIQMTSGPRLNKVLAIALSTLAIVKNLAKKGEIMDGELQTQIKLIFKNCELIQNNILLRIQSEGVVFLHIPQILKEPSKQLELFFREQEVTLQQLTQLQQQDDWLRKAKITAIIANLVRYLDHETLLSNYSDRVLQIFQRIGKENHNVVRQFFLHYSNIITKRIGVDYQKFFNTVFPTCFHQMQTDIKTDYLILNSLGKMVDNQLRQNMGPVNESRRAQIVLTDFIDALLLSNTTQSNQGVLITSLDLIKSILVLDSDQLSGKEDKIIQKVFSIIKTYGMLNLDVKIKCIELFATFIYRGFYTVIKEIMAKEKTDMIKFFIDELNTANNLLQKPLSDLRMKKKLYEKTRVILNNNEEFEKLINFKQVYNFNNEKLQNHNDKEIYKPVIYKYTLELLYLMLVKIGGSQSIQEFLDLTKFIVQYKHSSIQQQFEEQKKGGPSQSEKQSDIMTDDKKGQQLFNFTYDLNEKVRYFCTKAFKNFIVLFSTVDNPHNKNDLRKYLGQLISLAFTIISDDSQLLKKAGFALIIALVKLFRYSIEKIGDDDEDPENQMKVYMNNPLLLEQYEAQIFSIIRQNIAIQNNNQADPSVLLQNYKLIYHFLTTPICKDTIIIGKILQMLTESMINNFQIFLSSEMIYYEKILTELHYRKLVLLSKLIITCFSKEPFKRIETNAKRIQNEPEEKSGLIDKPSKFQNEDKERLIRMITPELMKNIADHINIALQDCLLILTLPKSTIKNIKDFTFIRNGSRSAYNQETIEKSVQYFLKALSLMKEFEQVKQKQVYQLSQDQQLNIHCLLVYSLGKSVEIKKEQSEDQKGKDQKQNALDAQMIPYIIYNHIKAKQLFLRLLNKLVTDKKLILNNQEEIEQYTNILNSLQSYGVSEINEEIALFYSNMIPIAANLDNISDKINLLDKIITNQAITLASITDQIQDNNEITMQEVNLIKQVYNSVGQLINTAEFIRKNTTDLHQQQLMDLINRVVTYFVYEQTQKLYAIHNDQLSKFLTNQVISILNLISDNKMNEMLQVLYQAFVREIVETMKNREQSDIKQQLMILILINLINNQLDQSYSIDVINSTLTDHSKILATLIKNMTIIGQKDPLKFQFAMKILIQPVISKLYQCLQQSDNDSDIIMINDYIQYLILAYSLFKEIRLFLIEMIMLLIFTIIQNKNLPGSVRNQQVEVIFKVFQIDDQVFKGYLISSSTAPEKIVIEKIIRELSAKLGSGQQQQMQNQQKKADDKGGAQNEGVKKQGTIQLTMNFKKK